MGGPLSCDVKSDYRLSVLLILITQIVAVVIALLVQTVRIVYIFKAQKTSKLKDGKSLERQYFWMHNLNDLQFNPFLTYINRRHPVSIVLVKYLLFFLYWGFFLVERVVLALVIGLTKVLLYFIPLVYSHSDSVNRIASTSHLDLNFIKLKPYVLYREGEEQMIEMLMESASNVTGRYINSGKKTEPKHLIELLSDYMSHDFRGVISFDCSEVPPLNQQKSLPNCWALPVVTLTSIAIALPNVDGSSIDKLVKGVKEGFLYVSIIENGFCNRHDLSNIKAAASIAWAGVDLRCRWLDVDLKKLALLNKSPLESIKSLSRLAEEKFPKMMESNVLKAIAAHSMYKICQTLLREYQDENNLDSLSKACQNESNLDKMSKEYRNENLDWLSEEYQDENYLNRLSERIYAKVCITISDILGACFTNLKQWIILECSRKSPEKRREAAYHILKLFGETEKIMKMVEQREITNLSLDQMEYIDNWREFLPPV